MKLRHTAAFALVGWYLVLIPDEAQMKKLRLNYPPQYHIWDTYPDKSSCERDLAEAAKSYADSKVRWATSCVMPDDPSLKGKARVRRLKPN